MSDNKIKKILKNWKKLKDYKIITILLLLLLSLNIYIIIVLRKYLIHSSPDAKLQALSTMFAFMLSQIFTVCFISIQIKANKNNEIYSKKYDMLTKVQNNLNNAKINLESLRTNIEVIIDSIKNYLKGKDKELYENNEIYFYNDLSKIKRNLQKNVLNELETASNNLNIIQSDNCQKLKSEIVHSNYFLFIPYFDISTLLNSNIDKKYSDDSTLVKELETLKKDLKKLNNGIKKCDYYIKAINSIINN